MSQGKLCILMFTVLAALCAVGQQGPPAAPQAEQSSKPNSSTQKSKEKPALVEATRVSTAEAVRKAATDSTKARGSDAAARASDAPDVLEFRPADAAAQDAGNATTLPSKDSRKSGLKNVHGSAYGGGGSGKQAGGSVGTTSKNGKSSVYVETNRQTTSDPH